MQLGTRVGGCRSCQDETTRPLNRCDDRHITCITRAGKDVIVTLSDCTFFRASMDVVDGSLKSNISNLGDLIKQVEELQRKQAALDASLLPMTGFDSSEQYSVIGPTYTQEVIENGDSSSTS